MPDPPGARQRSSPRPLPGAPSKVPAKSSGPAEQPSCPVLVGHRFDACPQVCPHYILALDRGRLSSLIFRVRVIFPYRYSKTSGSDLIRMVHQTTILATTVHTSTCGYDTGVALRYHKRLMVLDQNLVSLGGGSWCGLTRWVVGYPRSTTRCTRPLYTSSAMMGERDMIHA